MPLLTLVIVYHDQISPLHLDFLLDALNRQTSRAFNTFWINQVPGGGDLATRLAAEAGFAWRLFNIGHPVVAGVVCWDLIGVMALLMEHAEIGEWFAYLHLECLPEASLVRQLTELLPAIAQDYGPRAICMLNQLWCPLRVEQLDRRLYPEQLRLADNLLWERRVPYEPFRREMPFAYWEYRWEEDAFLMPSALARELKLFSAVREPLFFQDVFDIFTYLGDKPYTRDLHWIRLRDAVVYHLLHPRPFREYRREFFDAVLKLPELFGHLAHYSFAQGERHFIEDELMRRLNITDAHLNDFYNHLRHGYNGTLTLWRRALDSAHGLEDAGS